MFTQSLCLCRFGRENSPTELTFPQWEDMCFLAQARRVPTLVPEHTRAPCRPGPSPSVLTAPGGRPAVGEDGARGDHIPSPGGDARTSLRSGQQRAAACSMGDGAA